MIFLTLGSFPLSFNRFVKAVDEGIHNGLIKEDIFGQIGHTEYEPKYFPFSRMLEKEDFDKRIKDADAILSHAGIGNIFLALSFEKPILVFPRLRRYKEMVNDHQLETADKFEAEGYILVANNEQELYSKIVQLKSFKPKKRIPKTDLVADRIAQFLSQINK